MNTKIAPGCWIDGNGAMHISAPDLLDHFGWPDTPENRDRVCQLAQEELRKLAPTADIQVVD